ncbi:MAG: hypothetical protein H0T60_12105 [Acidobacteria bacterium]|nr:hypothetical protein [Acidobacteriota bacterium]
MDTTQAYTVPEFCQAHRFSKAFYYLLKQRGIAPREMHIGGRRLISKEAAAEWRRERELASETEAA